MECCLLPILGELKQHPTTSTSLGRLTALIFPLSKRLGQNWDFGTLFILNTEKHFFLPTD